jgi:hypothetical protein
MLIVLLTWYASAELIDGYRLVNTVNPRAAFTTAASALTLGFVALRLRREWNSARARFD